MIEWNDAMDAKLIEGVVRGLSRRAVARKLGISKNAAIARYNRISGIKFPSDVNKARIAKFKRAEKRRAEKTSIAAMLGDLHQGVHRQHAMRTAWKRGATMAAIGREVGLSAQRVHQIISARR